MEKYNTQKFVVVVVTIVLAVATRSLFPDWKEEEAPGRPSDCCHWEEVLCDGESGRVDTLFLGYVRGADEEWYVNASLFLPFAHLRILDLSGNSIIGWTHHLSQLSSLEDLYLSDNKLRGVIDLYDVEALQNLQFLDLGGNCVDGFKRIHGGPRNNASKLDNLSLNNSTIQDASTLLDSLQSFPSLKALDLRGNDFKGAIETTDSLCKLKKVQELYIAKNGLYELPLCLRNLSSLRILDLRGNNLHGKLPFFLANLTTLQRLDLTGNSLQDELPFFLADLNALEYLDLSVNQLGGNVANSPLTKLTSLQALSLSNNKFQIPYTFKPFANHSNLLFLSLDGNTLIADYATNQPSIPKFQLYSLSLSSCNISATLPSFILHQHKLQYLDLSHNYIDGSFPTWIIENNTFLFSLRLANNS